jgi:hypothetical protein
MMNVCVRFAHTGRRALAVLNAMRSAGVLGIGGGGFNSDQTYELHGCSPDPLRLRETLKLAGIDAQVHVS